MSELLTSLDVVNQSFKKSMRGYDAAEVDEFLDNVAETLQIYAQRNKDLERELLLKAENLAEYEKIKDSLHEALLMAQRSADEKVKNAQDEAEKIVAEAMEKADCICHEATLEDQQLRENIMQIKKLRGLYEQEFRGILSKFGALLNQTVSASGIGRSVNELLSQDEEAEPAAEEVPPEEAETEVRRPDLESAFNVLGVDPKSFTREPEGK